MLSSTYSVGSLVGRQEEIRPLDELIGTTRTGSGGALVLRGEAGIGKSALLEHARSAASGFRVVQASGSEFESELPFAALQQLCRPLCSPSYDHLAGLPAQHRAVLEVAFGLATGIPDVHRVGLATLELLSSAAREQPLLCVIDDAQWLDSASAKALAFVARRVSAEPIAVVAAVRQPSATSELDELPGLEVGRLSDSDARTLLAANSSVTFDQQVCDRIMAEAHGNPLALLQLPGTDSFDLPATSSVPTRIERSFQAGLAGLPADARLLLTIASADPTGDPGLLWPAARRLDIDVKAAASAATSMSRLVEFSPRVRFCHPLARSAVYLAADADQRRTAHRVLAEVTNPTTDPDRRVWHRARASAGPDEDVAAELARSASRAQARGGLVAAAAFLERAAELSLDVPQRIERTLAAARARFDAGALDAATKLLTTVENSSLAEYQHADVELLRGQIAFLRHHDGDGPKFMIRAGRRLAALDPERSRGYFLDALEMSMAVGRPAGGMEMVLTAAQSAAPASHPPDLLDALSLLTTSGERAAAPLLRKVLHDPDHPLWTQRPALAVVIAAKLWEPETHRPIMDWLLTSGQESGSPLILRFALAQVAFCAALSGDVGQAMSAITEEEAITDAIGGAPLYFHRLALASFRGRRQEALALIETATAVATERGTGQLIANLHWATAVLNNSLADYPAALASARRAITYDDLFLTGFFLLELIEAAVRCGEHEDAVRALAMLTERTDASPTPTALGIAAYARALVTGVEGHYREAVQHLEKSPLLPYRARAHLVYGEWLRREGRRRDCRVQLRVAHELLSEAGLEAFARRAADELRATGEKTGGRSTRAQDQLTAQELHIARLVATGATSNEVAARLFISPRTVDAHLRNIFRKLGITSRRQLRDRPDLRAG